MGQKENRFFKPQGILLLIGVLLPFTAPQAGFIMNPVLTGISARFPELSYSTITYLVTLVSLFGIPFNFLSGYLAGRKVKYKTLVVAGAFLMAAGGVMPLFTKSFLIWCICRCFVGAGMGMIMPLGNALITGFYKGEQAVKVQGMATVVLNVTGIVLQLLTGWLAASDISWAWIIHSVYFAVAALALIAVPEPQKQERVISKEAGKQEKLHPAVWLLSLNFSMVFLFSQILLLSVGNVIQQYDLGNSAIAGMLTSIFTVGGMMGGFLLKSFHDKFGKNFLFIMHMMLAFGHVLAFFTRNVYGLGIACFVIGVGTFTLWPALANTVGSVSPGERAAIASAVFMVLLNIGSFLASPVCSIIEACIGKNPVYPMACAAMAMFGLAVGWKFWQPAYERLENEGSH